MFIWKIPAEFSLRFVLGMVRVVKRNGPYSSTLKKSNTEHMKRFYVIILILISVKSYAQNTFGFFGGLNLNLTNAGIYESIGSENSIGLHLGVLYEYELNTKLKLRPKLVFSQQGDGTNTELNNNFNFTNLDYKTTYLNIPVDIKFGNKVYFITGPQIGFLLNTKKETADFGDLNSHIDFGLNLGGGFEVENLFFEIGVYQGLTTIYDYKRSDGIDETIKNSLVRFTIGYKL